MSDPVWPQRRQPTRLPRPWDSQGKNTGVGCHFFLQCVKVKSESEVAQSCPTLSDPMDCSPPGCCVHGIFQARGLEWGAIAFSMIELYMETFSAQSWQWKKKKKAAAIARALCTTSGGPWVKPASWLYSGGNPKQVRHFSPDHSVCYDTIKAKARGPDSRCRGIERWVRTQALASGWLGLSSAST